MENEHKQSLSDDEDLESLRLAALQSLKKKNASANGISQTSQGPNSFAQFHEHEQTFRHGNRGRGGYPNKRGRFFGGRGSKNGQFYNNRVRSSNLISITPVGSDRSEEPEVFEASSNSKLSLPQDRYCGNEKTIEVGKTDESSSKFDRYKDSDESDEDSDEDKLNLDSGDESPLKLERSDSLEALMQELDDEIQGKSKGKEKENKPEKVKSKNKRKKEVKCDTVVEEGKLQIKDQENKKDDNVKHIKKEAEPIVKQEEPVKLKLDNQEPEIKKRRHSPPPQRDYHSFRGKPRNFRRSPPFQTPHFLPSLPPIPHFPPSNILPAFNPTFGPPNLILPPINPPFFDRPLSPLHINADTLQTQTMAPLSPRSAAFVLENRAIIEKRKRSPRRSYSRSPSPRRRSLSPRSPRRSPSPLRRRSRSPKRRSLSPRKRSVSPKRKSLSPRRKDRKDPAYAARNKPSIRERLGLKSAPKPDSKTEKDKPIADSSPKKEDKPEKPIDPVLEARKRKFESKEIKVKEGVIRLKPKDEPKAEIPEENVESQKKAEEMDIKNDEPVDKPVVDNILNEDLLLEDDELEIEPKVDLFSDEDSGSENEGRFKAKEQPSVKPPVLSFAKLINGTKKELKPKPLLENRDEKSSDRVKGRSRTPPLKKTDKDSGKVTSSKRESTRKRESIVKKTQSERSSVRNRIIMKSERHPTPKRFERKIEIKIKNPAKYEKEEKPKKEEKGGRKVEVGGERKSEDEGSDFETEVIVENDGDEVENTVSNEGDLRAQLSKKRAEKMHKVAAPETVPSRLLQNALQNALRKSKKSKSHELTSSELASIKSLFTADFIASRLQLTVKPKRQVKIYQNKKLKFGFRSRFFTDGKLPIHLRLGLASNSDVFAKPKRKSRKRKSREALDQV